MVTVLENFSYILYNFLTIFLTDNTLKKRLSKLSVVVEYLMKSVNSNPNSTGPIIASLIASMGSTKRFGLTQLATHNVARRGGLNSVCSLYRNGAGHFMSTATAAQTHLQNPELSSFENLADCRIEHGNELGTKLQPQQQQQRQCVNIGVGVGISQRRRLFSSVNHTRPGTNNSSTFRSPKTVIGIFNSTQQRGFSSLGPSYVSSVYDHLRYQPSNGPRIDDIAKDISRSIQSELMDIDSRTKSMISCKRTKFTDASKNNDKETQPQLTFRRLHGGDQLRFDPLDGWNHPTAIKQVDVASLNDNLVTQRKPLRRKSASIRFKGDLKEFMSSQHQLLKQLPVTQSRNSTSQLGEMYVKSAKQRSQLQNESLIMSIPTNDPESVNSGAPLMQLEDYPKAKHDDPDASRLDREHYASKTVSNLMSASQRLINKRDEGVRRHMINAREIVNEKNAVHHSVSMSSSGGTNPSMRAIPKIRPVSMGRMKESLKSTMKMSANKLLALQNGQLNLAENAQRTAAAFSTWKRSKSTDNDTQWGERRVSALMPEVLSKDLSAGNPTPDKNRNTIQMPNEYTKESAVQRLGVSKMSPSQLVYLQQRGRN